LLFIGLLIYASVVYHYDRIANNDSRLASENSIDYEYKPDNAFETYSSPNPEMDMTSTIGTNDYGQRQMRSSIIKTRRSSASSYSRFYDSSKSDDGCSHIDGLPSAAAGQEARYSYQPPASPGSSLNSPMVPPSASLVNSDYIVSRRLLTDEQAKMYWQRHRTFGPASSKNTSVNGFAGPGFR
jgi:hypothetical protein